MVHLLTEQIEKIAEETAKGLNPKHINLLAKIFESKVSHTNTTNKIIANMIKETLKNNVETFTLDGMVVQDKEAVISFLNQIDNILIADQIKIA